jgi:hypothetical protein
MTAPSYHRTPGKVPALQEPGREPCSSPRHGHDHGRGARRGTGLRRGAMRVERQADPLTSAPGRAQPTTAVESCFLGCASSAASSGRTHARRRWQRPTGGLVPGRRPCVQHVHVVSVFEAQDEASGLTRKLAAAAATPATARPRRTVPPARRRHAARTGVPRLPRTADPATPVQTWTWFAHLEQTERHKRCRRQPYARELEHTHGVHRFQLECSGGTRSVSGRRTSPSETVLSRRRPNT